MAIALDSRRVADITLVTCRGRLVHGDESRALQQLLDDVLLHDPRVLLHLGEVDFIDSSGLGLLVRYATRTRNAHGDLKLCALSSKVAEVLKVTKLHAIFDSYQSEVEAITAFYRRAGSGVGSSGFQADILCVVQSSDIQAYVRGLLTQAGYGVLSVGNLPDALILLQATQPKVVIIGTDLRHTRATPAAEKFNRLADAFRVIELAADFSHRDAGEAGSSLLEQLRAVGINT